jgi:hypothetical protein
MHLHIKLEWSIIYWSAGAASTHVRSIKIIFKIPCPNIKNIPDYSTTFSISLHRFLSFENCDISKDNIISGKAAKVLWHDKYNTIGLQSRRPNAKRASSVTNELMMKVH